MNRGLAMFRGPHCMHSCPYHVEEIPVEGWWGPKRYCTLDPKRRLEMMPGSNGVVLRTSNCEKEFK